MPVIEAAALRKCYGRDLALHGLDLAVERGAAFGLIGLNGAGKTTFIKLLLSVVRPTSGTVRVLGGSPEEPAVRARIGYLPERLHLPDALKPAQFLSSVARLKGLDAEPSSLSRALERVGLIGDAHRRIGGFSKGMRQRLGLAAALLGSPDLLVLDEPTDGVDPLGRAAIRAILTEERARGATLFLNSHLLSETERVCDRIGILAGGKLLREGTLAELCGEANAWIARFAEPVPEDALLRIGWTRGLSPGTFRCHAADADALSVLLDRARAGGARLVELRPDARTLEEVLSDVVGDA